MPEPTLALADVHRITADLTDRRLEIFVFDHHRTAFTLWAHTAARLGRALTLVSLDRHLDLGAPLSAAPGHQAPLEALDAFARHRLAPANDDHIRAAMASGAIGDALLLARSHAPPDLADLATFRDGVGRLHQLRVAPAPGRVGPDDEALVEQAGAVVLDVDLDTFTTRSDGHLDEVLAWDRERMALYFALDERPELWGAIRRKLALVTIAREPYHCGGLSAGARVWLDFAAVFFPQVLGVPAPP